MKNIHNWVNTLLVGVVVILVLVGGNQPVEFSDKQLNRLAEQMAQLGAGSRFPNGISADTTSPSGAGNIRGTTLTMTGASTFATTVVVSGSFTAPSSNAATTTIGGVTFHADTQAFDTATTTVCSLQSPSATSTLIRAGGTFDVSSTTATKITMAKAANAFATTTFLGRANVGADEEATISASTTPPNSEEDPDIVFGPNEWFVIGMENNIGTFSPEGDCYAFWITAN